MYAAGPSRQTLDSGGASSSLPMSPPSLAAGRDPRAQRPSQRPSMHATSSFSAYGTGEADALLARWGHADQPEPFVGGLGDIPPQPLQWLTSEVGEPPPQASVGSPPPAQAGGGDGSGAQWAADPFDAEWREEW